MAVPPPARRTPPQPRRTPPPPVTAVVACDRQAIPLPVPKKERVHLITGHTAKEGTTTICGSVTPETTAWHSRATCPECLARYVHPKDCECNRLRRTGSMDVAY